MNLRYLILVLTAIVVVLIATLTGSAMAQELMTEEEFERRFQENPEALYESCIANETTIIVTDTSNGTWYAMFWKIVKDAGCNPIGCATITVAVPPEAKVKANWCDTWQKGGSVNDHTFFGFAVIWFKWNTDPGRKSITVHLTVYKEGYQPVEEDVTIYGNWRDSSHGCCCNYKPNCLINTLYPPPSAPEFPVETSAVLSLATACYLMIRRKAQRK